MVAALLRRALAAVFVAALAWIALPALAQGLLPVPALTARVIDQTGTLDAAQRSGLETKLAAFEQRKGSQIVVLMVPTTQPEDIASYAPKPNFSVQNEAQISTPPTVDFSAPKK